VLPQRMRWKSGSCLACYINFLGHVTLAFVLFLRKCIYTGVGVMSGRIVIVIVQVFLVCW
jgi:hypothetical protein